MTGNRDMTTGGVLRAILLFAVPLFLENILQQVYSLVDTMIVGYNLGDAAIAAIGCTTPLFDLLITFASGLNNGFAVPIANAYGERDMAKIRASILAVLWLDVAIALLATAAGLLGVRGLLGLLNVPEALMGQATRYIVIVMAGYGVTMLFNMFSAILRAVGDSRTPLLFVGIAFACNIVLDLALVAGAGMGVAGAALGTVISQLISVALCARHVWTRYAELIPWRSDVKASRERVAPMLKAGMSMGIMYSVLCVGGMVLQSAVNLLGETVIAAHTAARKLVMLFMQPMMSVSTANTMFIGQNWGAGKVARIREGVRKVALAELLWAGFAIAFVFAFGRTAVRLMTNTSDREMLANAAMNLRINFIFYLPLGLLLCLRTTMQAMGSYALPVILSGVELLIKIAGAYLIVPRFDYRGASFVEPSSWVICGAIIVVAFMTGTRKKLSGVAIVGKTGE